VRLILEAHNQGPEMKIWEKKYVLSMHQRSFVECEIKK
jgi:hypothetical protein